MDIFDKTTLELKRLYMLFGKEKFSVSNYKSNGLLSIETLDKLNYIRYNYPNMQITEQFLKLIGDLDGMD